MMGIYGVLRTPYRVLLFRSVCWLSDTSIHRPSVMIRVFVEIASLWRYVRSKRRTRILWPPMVPENVQKGI
ncbi:hypothetical protein DTO006G1_5926 [Penicillium roqueforti]|uniref:uncharacterized protein n=1 Tax=Penicillium roqueforti TaxID=5082 RepID=UPI00190B2FF2|nr:uncharacterized protein LCP9604111_4065 [Penicillium roqueforti]KAF9249965.1 hypothetical protein LCP9604111_4065 [Penicillium roqueforti]KAI1837176.1 hypothetical protein CBS147337_2428 [Penicillium roqueforti]KAI2681164.1 hypothetical protein LCP963914a_6674 [Penicillium roqueforti]KAI2704595.1 hypothetical protein CBS147372_3064 [Penicillium roqueforti]KAI2707234.1 hypothetical protein CBS147332_6888 [Penicillium roqueforti]